MHGIKTHRAKEEDSQIYRISLHLWYNRQADQAGKRTVRLVFTFGISLVPDYWFTRNPKERV